MFAILSLTSIPCTCVLNYINYEFSNNQVEEHRGKRVKRSLSKKNPLIDKAFPALEIGGPSERKTWPQPGVPLSSDSSDDEEKLVSFADIMDATERAVDAFEGDKLSQARGRLPWWLSPESSATEYSSAVQLSNNSSSPQDEEVCDCAASGTKSCHEVIILSSDSDEDDDVEIIG